MIINGCNNVIKSVLTVFNRVQLINYEIGVCKKKKNGKKYFKKSFYFIYGSVRILVFISLSPCSIVLQVWRLTETCECHSNGFDSKFWPKRLIIKKLSVYLIIIIKKKYLLIKGFFVFHNTKKGVFRKWLTSAKQY